MLSVFTGKPVIVCIGTTKVSGDSLGPKVGEMLLKSGVDAYVYGTVDRPVTGINYPLYASHVKTHHSDSMVIAVDACLGAKEDVGRIKLKPNGLRAGSALNKSYPFFGDVAVLGIVAENNGDNLNSLVNAESDFVDAMARKITDKIFYLLDFLRLNYAAANKI